MATGAAGSRCPNRPSADCSRRVLSSVAPSSECACPVSRSHRTFRNVSIGVVARPAISNARPKCRRTSRIAPSRDASSPARSSQVRLLGPSPASVQWWAITAAGTSRGRARSNHCGDGAVQRAPLVGEHHAVRHVLHHRMAEAVRGVSWHDESAPRQHGQHLPERRVGRPQRVHGRDRLGVERLADGGRHLHRELFVHAQPIQPIRNRALHRIRKAVRPQPGAVIDEHTRRSARLDDAGVQQRAHQLADEQGIAARLLIDDGGELGRDVGHAEPPAHQQAHVVRAEPREVDDVYRGGVDELGGLEWRVSAERTRHQDQQQGRHATPGGLGERERERVHPLDVVEHDHEGPGCGGLLQQVHDQVARLLHARLPEDSQRHVGVGHGQAEDFGDQRCVVRNRRARRHRAAEPRNAGFGARRAVETEQAAHHRAPRHVCRRRGGRVHRACGQRDVRGLRAREEAGDQGGLAHARVAANHHRGRGAGPERRQRIGQQRALGPSPNHLPVSG